MFIQQIWLKKEIPSAIQVSNRIAAMMRHGAMILSLGLILGASVFAQPPGARQTAQTPAPAAESEDAAEKEDKKGGKPDKGAMDTASLLEEMRRMRQVIDQMSQMIERQEARISKLESEKSAAAAKMADVDPDARQTVGPNNRRASFPHHWFPPLRSSAIPAPAEPAPADAAQAILAAPASQGISIQTQSGQQTNSVASSQAAPSMLSAADRDTLDFWRDTTVNVVVDGYYGYNFNRPLGGINLLRAYDVLSNSFSLNQAGVVFEHAPNVEAGRRFGARLDLMFGQATETLQGSAVNELRPQVFRHVWQAYGSYVAPVGKGLTIDYGKFASALGYETNYTKDNFNYSRSYWFNILPFYHFGFRVSYPFNDKFTANYWVINGINQSEDFNAWKSQAALLTYKPTTRIVAQFNYFSGQEGRVRTSILNPTFPPLPTQPGLSPDEIRPEHNGRIHILDAYATFNVTDKLTFAIEGDYLVNRSFNNSPPSGINGGAAYARYQFSPGFALAGRFEYVGDKLSDDGVSLFTGLDQALKEITLTAEYKFGEGFLLRGEYRRDWSNRPFFLSQTPGPLRKEQNTATLGLVWWFGRKNGSW